MSPVWRPAVDPPQLDKFCHLSHDAQRVMAALYSDYHQRKQELLETQTAASDSRTYYQSIYEARFGLSRNSAQTSTETPRNLYMHSQLLDPALSNANTRINTYNSLYQVYVSDHSMEIDGEDFHAATSDSINRNLKTPIYTARRLDFDDDQMRDPRCPITGNAFGNSGRPVLNTNQTEESIITYRSNDNGGRNVNGLPESRHRERVYLPDTQISQDTSRYSDSPPIETQDYRILSQFHREESLCDTYDVCDSNMGINSLHVLSKDTTVISLADPIDSSAMGISKNAKFTKFGKSGRIERIGVGSVSNTDEVGDDMHKFKDNLPIQESALTRGSMQYLVYNSKHVDNERLKVAVSDNIGEEISDNTDTVLDGSQCLFSQDTDGCKPYVSNKSFRQKPAAKKCAKLQQMYERSKSFAVDPKQNSAKRDRNVAFPKKHQHDVRNKKQNEDLVNVERCSKSDFQVGNTELHIEDRPVFKLNFNISQEDNFNFNPVLEMETHSSKNDHSQGSSHTVSAAANIVEVPKNECKHSEIHNIEKPDEVSRNKRDSHEFTENEPELQKKLGKLTVGDENPVKRRKDGHILKAKNNANVDKPKEIKAVPRQTCDKDSLEESPYLERQKKMYPVFDKSQSRDAENVRFLKPEDSKSSAMKRASSGKGFKIPLKKSRQDGHKVSSVDLVKQSTCSSIVNISHLSEDKLTSIVADILHSDEVVIVTVYRDGSTQLRDSLFGLEAKKRQSSKSKHLSNVDGFAVTTKSSKNESVFMFPAIISDKRIFETTREFWNQLLSSEARKIGYNVKDMYTQLMTCYMFDHNKVDTSWTVLDPAVGLWLLDPDKPVSMFEQVLTTLQMPAQALSDSSLNALHGDMMLLSVAMVRLYQRLQSKDMWSLFICVETKLTALLAGMELRNIHVATHTLLQFSEILKKKLLKLEQQAHQAAGHAFLLSSHAQLRQVLFEKLRLDAKLPQKTKLAKTSVGRETSTSEAVLTQLSPFHSLPGIVLEHRQLQKLKSTYIDGILSCVDDGTLNTHWDQTAAATGRLTSYQPNIQAIPKVSVTISGYQDCYIVGREENAEVEIYARDPFISKPGWSLLAADFQQIELRLLGHLANDPVLLQIFNHPQIPDIFNALTSQWLSKSVETVTVSEREQTKRVVYSVMYGAGKEKLAEYLKISADNAKAIMASFLLKFPAVSQFTKSCIDFCQKNGHTCSIFKRRRLFPNIRHPSPPLRAQAERQCVNFCVQGSAADICKAAMLQVESALAERSDLNARLLAQIHDELLLEVADSDLQPVTALIKSVMECQEKLCGSMVKLKVPIPVSISVGKSWGHMETFPT